MDAARWLATVDTVNPAIEKLLILQERDGRRLGLEQSLARLPLEVKQAEDKIAAEKEALAAISQRLKEMEVQRSELDKEIKGREDKINKYKNQQLSVKKNEEYQALTHEIESLEKEISGFEEKELEVMMAIDEAKEKAASESAEHDKTIKLYEGELANLKEREGNLKADLAKAQEAASAAEAEAPEPFLGRYQHIREHGIKFPLVVPLDGQKCGGCHLRISGEVETVVRRQQDPAHCDNCQRMLYWE